MVIRQSAYRAVRRIPEIAPLRFDPPYTLTITMRPEPGKKRGAAFLSKSNDFLDLMRQRPGKPAKPAARPARRKKASRKRIPS